jgi:hypothetical protein
MDKERWNKIQRIERVSQAARDDIEYIFQDAYVELMIIGLKIDEMEREALFSLGLIQEKYKDLSFLYKSE